MSNKYANSLIQAVEIISKKLVESAGYDTTVLGIIDQVPDSDDNIYKVKINGELQDATYNGELAPGTEVWVTTPQNDVNNGRQIIGIKTNSGAVESVEINDEELYLPTTKEFSIGEIISPYEFLDATHLVLEADFTTSFSADIYNAVNINTTYSLIATVVTGEDVEVEYKLTIDDIIGNPFFLQNEKQRKLFPWTENSIPFKEIKSIEVEVSNSQFKGAVSYENLKFYVVREYLDTDGLALHLNTINTKTLSQTEYPIEAIALKGIESFEPSNLTWFRYNGEVETEALYKIVMGEHWEKIEPISNINPATFSYLNFYFTEEKIKCLYKSEKDYVLSPQIAIDNKLAPLLKLKINEEEQKISIDEENSAWKMWIEAAGAKLRWTVVDSGGKSFEIEGLEENQTTIDYTDLLEKYSYSTYIQIACELLLGDISCQSDITPTIRVPDAISAYDLNLTNDADIVAADADGVVGENATVSTEIKLYKNGIFQKMEIGEITIDKEDSNITLIPNEAEGFYTLTVGTGYWATIEEDKLNIKITYKNSKDTDIQKDKEFKVTRLRGPKAGQVAVKYSLDLPIQAINVTKAPKGSFNFYIMRHGETVERVSDDESLELNVSIKNATLIDTGVPSILQCDYDNPKDNIEITLTHIETNVEHDKEEIILVDDGAKGKDGKDGKDGVNGKDGKDGTSPYLLDLTNENISIPSAADGTISEEAAVQVLYSKMQLYYGDAAVSDNVTYTWIYDTYSYSGAEIDNLTTFNNKSLQTLVSENDTLSITAQAVVKSGDFDLTFTKILTIAKNPNSAVYALAPESAVIKPDAKKFTFRVKKIEANGKIEYLLWNEDNGVIKSGDFIVSCENSNLVLSADNTHLVITKNTTEPEPINEKFKIVLQDAGETIDEEEIVVVKDGKDGKDATPVFEVDLTNENINLPAYADYKVESSVISSLVSCEVTFWQGTDNITDSVIVKWTCDQAPGEFEGPVLNYESKFGELTVSDILKETSVQQCVFTATIYEKETNKVILSKAMKVIKSPGIAVYNLHPSKHVLKPNDTAFYCEVTKTEANGKMEILSLKVVNNNEVIGTVFTDIKVSTTQGTFSVESKNKIRVEGIADDFTLALMKGDNQIDSEEITFVKDGEKGADGANGKSIIKEYYYFAHTTAFEFPPPPSSSAGANTRPSWNGTSYGTTGQIALFRWTRQRQEGQTEIGWEYPELIEYKGNPNEVDKINLVLQATGGQNKKGVFAYKDGDGEESLVINADLIKTGALLVGDDADNPLLKAGWDTSGNAEVQIAGWTAEQNVLSNTYTDKSNKESSIYLNVGNEDTYKRDAIFEKTEVTENSFNPIQYPARILTQSTQDRYYTKAIDLEIQGETGNILYGTFSKTINLSNYHSYITLSVVDIPTAKKLNANYSLENNNLTITVIISAENECFGPIVAHISYIATDKVTTETILLSNGDLISTNSKFDKQLIETSMQIGKGFIEHSTDGTAMLVGEWDLSNVITGTSGKVNSVSIADIQNMFGKKTSTT